jgi:non-canonical purine NTP pyrophosphatase (RdgB/HAM1 family)
MKTIVFATNNSHKLEEVRDVVSGEINIVSLSEIGCPDDIPETSDTIEGNALQKAGYIKEHFGYDCFADDTGLEVEALNGEPGVRSARYAGDNHDSEANTEKLLKALEGKSNRKARFRTVIALLVNGTEEFFEGVVNGHIVKEKRGKEGFGYDPVFQPDGYNETFAELGSNVKNKISHRAIATRSLVDRLKMLIITALAIIFSHDLAAQNNKDWQTYLAYNEATGVAETNERVYVLANGSLFSYGKEDSEIRLYSKQGGLSDTDISSIKYSPDNHILIIIYSNGNIDLYDGEGIKNMPFLKNATNIQSKKVNDTYLYNNFVYFATDFGIMVINLNKKEVTDTYKLNKSVKSVCIQGETILAATDEGLFGANLKDNLLDPNVWHEKKLTGASFSEKDIIKICVFKDRLFYCVKSRGIYYESEEGALKTLANQSYKDMTVQSGELLAYTQTDLTVFFDTDNYIHVNVGAIEGVSSLKDDGKYWIASGVNGLTGIQKGSDNQFTKIVSDIEINSPKRNYNSFMIFDKDKLLIAGGGRLLDRFLRPGTLMVYENDRWNNFDESKADNEIIKLIDSKSYDYVGVAVDPNDASHYYIATYGEGVIELKDDEFVKLHYMANSPLESAIPNDNKYVRIGSVCFDKNANLWVANSRANNAIAVLKPNGEWVSLYYPPLNYADKLDKIMITSNGQKWINIPYDGGIMVLDDNGTIDNNSDDRYNFFSSFKDAQSSTGASISASQYLCMAEDKSGAIWIGSNIGLLKCINPSRAIEDPTQLACSRLIRDGDAYFLSGESITAIAVDAENQKWIGTASAGVFLINEDGSETIYNFTFENSPLLSNSINSIAINDKTGEVFFGSDNGLVSFKSGVISGAKPFSDVYAFPNPVRPEFSDKVTITGLTNNANVKITDINGNLIYQGRAVGNRFVWNCRNYGGNRVATGIYLVLASTANASESVVTKIAVVK